jgi:hypothetical protein
MRDEGATVTAAMRTIGEPIGKARQIAPTLLANL